MTTMNRFTIGILALTTCLAQAIHADVIALGAERFLLLVEFLLDTVTDAVLTVNPPPTKALVIIADKPWERGGITSYGNVFWDPIAQEYRLYYVPVCWDVAPGFCYALATSKDGLHWGKPDLGVVEWKGSTDNNIVVWAQREGTVMIDPNAPPDRRYALISSHPELKARLFTSRDGIHFTMDETAIANLHSDSQISTFWDKDTRQYHHYPRLVHGGGRAVGFVTTKTMTKVWPENIPVVMAADDRDPAGLDLYTNACQKYEPARNAYLGFPTPYYHYNAAQRAYLNEPTLAIGGKTNDGVIETQLATSRDGRTWTRYRTPYVPLQNFDGLDIKIAMVIPGMLFSDGRIYQCFMGYTFTHGDTQIRYGDGGRNLGGVFLVEQRLDGFVSLDFDYGGGTVITAPFTFKGDELTLNINTSASGEARVAILDADGAEITGYGLEDARYINGNYLEKTVEWRDGATDVGPLAGTAIRLHFQCRGTKLYSFQFR